MADRIIEMPSGSVPSSRGWSVTEDVRAAHGTLLAAYAEGIRQSSLVASERQWYMRYAVRRFAEAHVKRRLDELAASYSQLACTASSDGERSWLDRATNDCESVAERLTRWRAPLALAFAPLIVGALAKTVGSVSLYDPGMLVFGPLVIGIAYALVHVGGWFEEKRRLFRECGVYRLENDLFDKLDRGKSPEPPLDYAFSGLAVVVALVGIGILIVDIYRFSTRTFVLVVLGAAMIASLAAQWALRHRAQESVD